MIKNLRYCAFILAGIFFFLIPVSFSNAQNFPFEINIPTLSGSFLAGEQAFSDLRTEEAANFFLDAAESDWENPAIIERAFIALVSDGRIEDGAVLAQHLIEMEPTNAIARLVLGTVALKERRYASAIAQFRRTRSTNFVGVSAIILASWSLIGENKFSRSQQLLRKLDRSGLEDFLIFHRALMADIAGKRDLALKYSKMAYETDPFIPRIVEARARILANSLLFDAAREVINNYQNEGYSHPEIEKIAKYINNKKRPGKMINNVQEGAAELYHNIGTALAREGDRELAYMFLRLGQYLDKDNAIIIMALGQMLEEVELYQDANELYATISTNSSLKLLSELRIAENLRLLGDAETAIKRLRNISTLNPTNIDALLTLGDILRFEKKYAEAIKVYTKIIELTGGNRALDWRFYYVRGIAYERSDIWELAEKDFLKALELNPNQPQVLNYLGYSWVDKNMNLLEGLELIKRAVNASPDDGYIIDSLGWAYYRLGQYDKAISALKRALNLLPNDPEINDHLGDVYWRVGRKLEARYQWKIAIDVDKDGVVTERAKPKLENGLD